MCNVEPDELCCRRRCLTDKRLSYSYMFDQGSPGQEGPVCLRKGEEKMYNLSYPVKQDNQIIEIVEFYFEQQEHGGGGCNCAEVDINCEEECRLVLMF